MCLIYSIGILATFFIAGCSGLFKIYKVYKNIDGFELYEDTPIEGVISPQMGDRFDINYYSVKINGIDKLVDTYYAKEAFTIGEEQSYISIFCHRDFQECYFVKDATHFAPEINYFQEYPERVFLLAPFLIILLLIIQNKYKRREYNKE